MSEIIKRYQDTISLIKSNIENNQNLKFPKIIAVSKTFKLEKILPLIDHGHIDYGENKVQEAVEKWTSIKEKKPLIKLHLIGRLQTNKVKFAIKIFDYIKNRRVSYLVKRKTPRFALRACGESVIPIWYLFSVPIITRKCKFTYPGKLCSV